MARPYVKRRTAWAERVMRKHYGTWPLWDEQVPLFDFRGWDAKTIESVGPLIFTRLMPRADLIALRQGEILVVEFDAQMNVTHVAVLDRYAEAVRNDYIRPDWRTRTLYAAYVTPSYDARIEAECARKGYRYIVEPEVAG